MNMQVGFETQSQSAILNEKQIRQNILGLAVPCAVEQILIMVVGIVSTILVGRINKEALSAVGLINVIINFIFVVFTALSTGCTVLVARLVGEGNWDDAKNAVKQSIVISVILSIFITITCFVMANGILRGLFGRVDAEVLSMALIYFRIVLFSLPLFIVNVIIGGALRGAGDTRTPLNVAYIVNILNVILGLILIFGISLPFLKFDGLGIVGAGIAITISRGVGGILIILAIYMPGRIIQLYKKERFEFNHILTKRILKVGIPAAVEQFIMQGGLVVLQMLISGMGTVAIAVYQVGMSVNSIGWMPVWGFAIAATTLVGQSLGSSKPELAELYVKKIIKMSMLIICCLGVITFLFSSTLTSIYSSEQEVISAGSIAIKIFSISLPFLCVVVIISSALRGAGDVVYVTITSFIGVWGFRILFTILINSIFGFGIYSVWIAIVLDFAARAVLYWIRFSRGKWKSAVV